MYVLSKNLHRRHLTASQLSTIAADSEPLLREEAKKRQATSGPGSCGGKPLTAKRTEGVHVNEPNELSGEAREIAGEQVGVGR